MRPLWLSRIPSTWDWIVIPSYKFMITLALLVAAAWIFRRLAAQGWKRNEVLNLLGLSIVAAILGGRLLYFMDNEAGRLFSISEMLRIYAGGYSLAGGAVAASAAAWLYLRYQELPANEAADAAAPAMGLAVTLARLGCFLGGCDFGTVTSLPWAVCFPPDSLAFRRHVADGLLPADASASLPVHPLQIYEAALGLMMMLLALRMSPRRSFSGQVYLLVVLFYCLGRFGLDFLRDLWMSAQWGPLLSGQVLALIGIGVSLLLYFLFRKHHAAVPENVR